MPPHPELLLGQTVAFTGRLAALTRPEAVELVRACGGRVATGVVPELNWLVIGQEGLGLKPNGRLTLQLRQARLLQRGGSSLEILREEEFFARLGLHDLQAAVCRRYTLTQLTRLLGLPRERIRSWIRQGLVRPVETVHRLEYFDFRQVTALKKIADLTQAGVPLRRIRASLLRLRTWLPESQDLLANLDWLAENQRFQLRLPGGRLAESNGQLLLEFHDAPETSLPFELAGRDLFEAALAEADAGQFATAAELYQALLLRDGSTPEVCFNLGNALYALHDTEAAVNRFREALALDPAYVECWNNLGTVLAELQETDAALRALRRAVDLAPDYADALYNLASTLEQAGQSKAARPYWQRYLQYDARGPWAEHARNRLASGEGL